MGWLFTISELNPKFYCRYSEGYILVVNVCYMQKFEVKIGQLNNNILFWFKEYFDWKIDYIWDW
jgi:hypothetical protein